MALKIACNTSVAKHQAPARKFAFTTGEVRPTTMSLAMAPVVHREEHAPYFSVRTSIGDKVVKGGK